METSTVSTKQTSIQYGLVLGGILSLITVLMYVINTELFTQWWIGILTLVIVIAVGIISTAKAKSLLGGYMSFKQAFSAYFITIAVGLAISTVVGILIFTVVDPDLATYLNEKTIEMSREFMERFGTPEAEMEKALADLEGVNNFSVANQLKSYAFGVIFQAVIGLLIALIFKRKDPNAIE
ncbi:DUF4199 domain-containing protein [Patiriisocius marinus]|uniref:DUF4199 domain-containing protein n=1 Tax=Patiriisocius marinus TaxID=1397112 RepID=A0A5J4J3W9_9FLAO|nr:DUF4199 domain-containing protein [Patiriisocius marinus]GER59157.1 hypothetical protein ULMA_12650 [Patiriisocius marinus]